MAVSISLSLALDALVLNSANTVTHSEMSTRKKIQLTTSVLDTSNISTGVACCTSTWYAVVIAFLSVPVRTLRAVTALVRKPECYREPFQIPHMYARKSIKRF